MRLLAAVTFALCCLLSTGTVVSKESTTLVPLGGNAFITHPSKEANEIITDAGLANWSSPKAIASVYFSVERTGNLEIALRGSLNGAKQSTALVSIDGQQRIVSLSSGQETFPAGTFKIAQRGYVKVDLRGLSRDGDYYGDISGLEISGSATAGGVTFADDPENFYWSRRGPSVHMGYSAPENSEYFYSELTVPRGQDPIGSYYMANGFGQGYFGIQVNSPTERRVLFSVWDQDAGKTTLVEKNPEVTSNDFGGEGTGGQSYLVFDWKAGKTYRFLTRIRPDGQGNTLFSAWFGTPCKQGAGHCRWTFIATWKGQGISVYQNGLYSFLESFDDQRGHNGRYAFYSNQWAASGTGTWTELRSARFTVDPTGENRQRLDFSGGSAGSAFTLRNGGFFNGSVPAGTTFNREPGWNPQVDLENLPLP